MYYNITNKQKMLGDCFMKKIAVILLALSLSIGMFTACASEQEQGKQAAVSSSLSDDEVKKIIEDNNVYAKTIFNDICSYNKDKIDNGQFFTPGKYFLELSSNDSELQNEGPTSFSDTEKALKVICLRIWLGLDLDEHLPQCVFIEINKNGYPEQVAYAEKDYYNYSGQYPDKTTLKTTFNIYDLKE